MPIVMDMLWPNIVPEQYEALRKLVNWEGDVPTGAMFHASSFDESGIHVTDIWESAEDFQRFVDSRLMPGTKQLGIPGQPQVQIRPVHVLFTPAYEPIRSTGRLRRAS